MTNETPEEFLRRKYNLVDFHDLTINGKSWLELMQEYYDSKPVEEIIDIGQTIADNVSDEMPEEDIRIRKIGLIEALGNAMAGQRGVSIEKLNKCVDLFDGFIKNYPQLNSKPVTNGEVVYRKVSVKERLPEKDGWYFAESGFSFFRTETLCFFNENNDVVLPIYWLEEISQSPVSNNKTIKFLKEENKILRKQLERQSPVMPSEEEIYEIGKKEIGYDRQMAVFDKKNADMVLYFWLKGAKYFRKSEDNAKEKRK